MDERKYNRFELLSGLDRIKCMPRSLISQKVKIPSVLFTRIGAEADRCRVSLVERPPPTLLVGAFGATPNINHFLLFMLSPMDMK